METTAQPHRPKTGPLRARRLCGALLLAGLVAGCGAPTTETPARLAASPTVSTALFGAPRPAPPARPNSEIARDILELGFRMESGREIPVLSRFERPIRVELRGEVPGFVGGELDRLLARMRNEAGLDVRRAAAGQPGEVVVEFIPSARMRALVPQASCFVVPRVAGWAEYVAARRTNRLDWTTLAERERASVFIPFDTTPQEIRDCLHEEIAQAMGPLNDLYELHESVFNDDNFQTILTGFDMLVLAAWYAPELRSGMSQAEVAARLPAVLARLNPTGGMGGVAPPRPRTPAVWVEAVETALGPGAGPAARREAARRALEIAEARGWRDGRLGFALYLRARFAGPSEGAEALAALRAARDVYRALPGGEVHAAHVEMQLAVHALSIGAPDAVLPLVAAALPVAERSENGALASTLMMLRAEALDRMGRPAEAQALRLDSLERARYGFGSEAAVQSRLAETAGLGRRPAVVEVRTAGPS